MGDARILIVEDEPLIALDLEAELEARGWAIAGVAGTTADAREIVGGHAVDLALLDVNLRGETTFGLAEELHSTGVALVFLSGMSGALPAPFETATKLDKPVAYDALDATLRKKLDRHAD